ncbi:MAG: hypothetical protein I8H71_00815 [Xanthomonadaceae bacterium]|nr:hypothetical protein [Xanthomonadaceae bacterium]
MPMELLKELAETSLPATFTKTADVDKLRVLRAAGLIAAMLPSPGALSGFARVLTITAKGKAALSESETTSA